MTDSNKLNPDAEKALRKLLLEVWSFQTKIDEADIPDSDWDGPLDDSEPTKNQELCDFHVALDGEAYRALKILGFESYEDLEADVWAKKPEEADCPECEPCIDMDHQKNYK